MGQSFNGVNTPAQGTAAKAGITAATVLKTSGGRVMSVNVNVTSSVTNAAAFTIYDSSTIAGTAASNLVYASGVSTAVVVGNQIDLDFPVFNGLVVVPNTAANLAVSYM